MLINVRGLVLARKKVAESDVIITLFTKTQGKLRIYVNGARHPKSRYASSTQPFVEGDFSVYLKKDLSSLGEVDIVNSHIKIREDMARLFLGTYMLELVDLSLEENDFIPGLYNRVSYALKNLSDAVDLKLFKVVYDLKIIQILGYEPSLFSCSHCGAEENLLPALSAENGGVLCTSCIKHEKHYTKFSLENLKWINFALKTPFKAIQNQPFDDKMLLKLDKWLETFIKIHVVRRPLKSLTVLND